jgi:membrane protease subunit (stomatin/prohibitin family)
MSAYQINQEFSDLRWGTMMPVTVMVGSDIVEVRARGTLAVIVVDPGPLAAALPDPDDLPGYLRSQVLPAITDLIGERSTQAANKAQLTAVTPETHQTLQAQLEPRFAALGLRLKSVTVEAIETV